MGSAMFRGSSYHTIDDKGRVVIPSRFRALIRAEDVDGLVISTLDSHLLAYTFKEWADLETRIKQIPEKDEALRRFRRMFIGNAHECLCDKHDRILIPPVLREEAGLQRDIVLVGVTDHFEIWSREHWDREKNAWKEDLKDPACRRAIDRVGI
jgi:MraZ protein